jgi:transcriptional regulator with XRE-family HTH domain
MEREHVAIRRKRRRLLRSLLKQARIDAGMVQWDVAEGLGLNQPFVSKYENGERALDLIDLREVCRALKTPFLDFIKNFEDAMQEIDRESR